MAGHILFDKKISQFFLITFIYTILAHKSCHLRAQLKKNETNIKAQQ